MPLAGEDAELSINSQQGLIYLNNDKLRMPNRDCAASTLERIIW